MTTKRVTMAQIQSQLEEARITIDRQRNEIEMWKNELAKRDEKIANLTQEIENLKKEKKEDVSNVEWEHIKANWERCDTAAYYRLRSWGKSAFAYEKMQAHKAVAWLQSKGKEAYVQEDGRRVTLNLRK